VKLKLKDWLLSLLLSALLLQPSALLLQLSALLLQLPGGGWTLAALSIVAGTGHTHTRIPILDPLLAAVLRQLKLVFDPS
jgi:hypothetical protein